MSLEPNITISTATWNMKLFHHNDLSRVEHNNFQTTGGVNVTQRQYQKQDVIGARKGFENQFPEDSAYQQFELQPYKNGMRPYSDKDSLEHPQYITNPLAGSGGYVPNLVSHAGAPLAFALDNETELEDRIYKEKFRMSSSDPLSGTYTQRAIIKQEKKNIKESKSAPTLPREANRDTLPSSHYQMHQAVNPASVIQMQEEVKRNNNVSNPAPIPIAERRAPVVIETEMNDVLPFIGSKPEHRSSVKSKASRDSREIVNTFMNNRANNRETSIQTRRLLQQYVGQESKAPEGFYTIPTPNLPETIPIHVEEYQDVTTEAFVAPRQQKMTRIKIRHNAEVIDRDISTTAPIITLGKRVGHDLQPKMTKKQTRRQDPPFAFN